MDMVTEEDRVQTEFNESFAFDVKAPLCEPGSFLHLDLYARRRCAGAVCTWGGRPHDSHAPMLWVAG